MSSNSRTFRTKEQRLFCTTCGFVWRKGQQSCPSCGGMKATNRWVQPTKKAKQRWVYGTFPWHNLKFPEGVTVTVSAPAGVGKSSMSALWGLPPSKVSQGVDPTKPILKNWISTEQDPAPVYDMFDRLGVPRPNIWSADQQNPKEGVLTAIKAQVSGPGDLTVVDSMSVMAVHDAIEVMTAIIKDGLRTGRRYLLINQQNHQGQMYGSVKLAYMPDVVAVITVDSFGRRRFILTKNRHGPLSTTYFEISPQGQIRSPNFSTLPVSIEGPFNDMELRPLGAPGAKKAHYDGLLKALTQMGIVSDACGYACAAFVSPASRFGFSEPVDVDARRAFAELHGLDWLDVETAVDWMQEAERDQRENGNSSSGPPPVDEVIR